MFYGTIPSFEWAPGAYFNCSAEDTVKRLETTPNTQTLEEELSRHMRKLYRTGRVSLKSDAEIRAAGNAPSGKALLVLDRDGIQYVESRVEMLSARWPDLFSKLAVMDGKMSAEQYKAEGKAVFTVEYPDLSLEDPADRREDAKVALTLHEAAMITDRRLLQIFQSKGVIPDTWDLDELEAEASAERDRKMAAMTSYLTTGSSEE